jgi:hypothetical protein
MLHQPSSTAFRFLALALILVLLAACNPAASPAPSWPPAAALALETSTPVPPTQVATAASATLLPSPASGQVTAATSAATSAQAAPSPAAAQTTVQVFLIAVGDNGQSGNLIGCGDSAIPVQVAIPATEGVLRAALQALFSVKDQYYGQSGLYNALYQSDIQVGTVTIESGTAIINLTGTLGLGGECDNPRVEAQIEQTAFQFPTVKRVLVFLNGRALEDVLSLKG